MELVEYIRLFRKWLWLIVLGAFLAGGAAFIVRQQQSEKYRTDVTILVGGFMESPNPSTTEIRTGFELAQTYAVLAKTYDTLEATIEAGGFDLTPSQLDGMVSTKMVANTSLLVLTITHTDPVLAADIANELAQQLIANSPSNLTPGQESQIELAEKEIENLTAQLGELRLQIENLDTRLAVSADQTEIDQLQERRSNLVDQVNIASANIAQFSATVASLQQRTNTLDIVERAQIPSNPIGTSTFNTVILGAFVGVSFAFGIALLVEYLDDTVKTPEELTELLAIPMLGTIARFGKADDSYEKRLITHQDPLSTISESYRAVRTNLLFSTNKRKNHFLVTSPGPVEGKSVTAANLAVVMASTGMRVLLVDADLRRPKVHEFFGLPNKVGLTTLLYADPGNVSSASALDEMPPEIRQCIQDTPVQGLRVITSGFKPANPTEILGSTLAQHWFQTFQNVKDVDAIVIDSPPTLVVADSYVLASAIKASILLVVQAGHTRRGAVLKAKEQFDQLEIEVRGTVLNAFDPTEWGYGYGYYQYYYYSQDGRAANRQGWRKFLPYRGKEQ